MRFESTSIALFFFFVATAAHAGPYEFIACNYADGKGGADLDRWVDEYESVLDAALDGYSATVLTPQYADGEGIPDFFWMGTWPDAQKLGLGLASWYEQGKGDEAMTALAKFADCDSSSLWWGRQVYHQQQ
jgi:hypothetical protein